VRGLSSAFVGAGARTIVPDHATAAIDIRLVKETPATAIVEKVKAHLAAQGYHIVSGDPDDATRAKFGKIVKVTVGAGGTNAYRTSPTLPIAKEIAEALARTFGRAAGAHPHQRRPRCRFAPFIDALGFPAISVPIVNYDNNQHGENENLRLGHFSRGIVTLAGVLRM